MRKSLIVSLLLLAFALGALGAARAWVDERQDAVEVTETVVYGDRAALAGLELEYVTHAARHLLWTTRCTFGGELRTHTDFQYSRPELRWQGSPLYGGVSFDMNAGNFSMSSSGELDLEDEERDPYLGMMLRPAADVATRTPDGGEHTETLRLKDYYDYYPMDVRFDLPVSRTGDYGEEQAAGRAFAEYFKVAVPEDQMVEVTVEKNLDGGVTNVQMSTVEGGIWLDSSSVVTEDGWCYFTVAVQRDGGGIAEGVGTVGDGYGLYVLPAAQEGEAVYARPEDVSLAWPVDSGAATIVALKASADQKQLLLVTHEGGACVLTVLDRATMEQVQRLELFPIDLDEEQYVGFRDLRVEADYLVAQDSMGGFVLLTPDGAGGRQIQFRGDLNAIEAWEYVLTYDAIMAFDGERLAVAAFQDGMQRHGIGGGSFCLAVYDKSGLIYAGEYDSSQDRDNTLVSTGSYSTSYVTTAYENPMRMEWSS